MFEIDLKFPTLVLAASIFFCASGCALRAQEIGVQLHLRNGSVVNTKIDAQQFEWTDIEQQTQKLDWRDVRELRLIEAPVSEQVEKVQQLVNQLTSPDYRLREEAESRLSSVEFAGPFKSLIAKTATEINDQEALYRIKRIMDALSDMEESEVPSAGFDKVTMQDSSTRLGDVSNFRIRCEVFGKTVTFNRKQVGLIQVKNESVSSKTIPRGQIQTQTFNQISGDFYKNDNDTTISFEFDSNGTPVTVGKAVDDFFANQGLLMRTEKPGYIQLTKYPFKFCPIDSGTRCVCPYDEESDRRLRGATIINFCIPGQPTSVAGVHRFGVFLERVEHSRDFVVEAYNVVGQMIGMVESSNQVCSFFGFESNELISQIRISTNKDLPGDLQRVIDGKVDETYAFDCVTYDRPKKIAGLSRRSEKFQHTARINMTNGDSLLVQQYSLDMNQISVDNPMIGARSEFDWQNVHSIAFPNILAKENKSFRQIMVQTKNGSIVRVEDESVLSSFDFIGHEFAKDEIVGIWDNKARLPLKSDFENESPIIVYPSCRIIADDLQFDQTGFSWNSDTSKKLIQQIQLGIDEEDFTEPEVQDPDLTPNVSEVIFANREQPVPSLWLKQPLTTELGGGHLLLNDNQFFVLGNRDGFRLKEINQEKKYLIIEFNAISKIYPLSRVVSLSLPKSNSTK